MELDKLIMEPALYYRKPEKIRRWQQQIGAGEAGWTQRTRPHHLGEDGMPQIHMIEDNTRSCVWPSRCGFFGYCHESLAIDDPEKFVARKPHHQPETGLVQIGVSGGLRATELQGNEYLALKLQELLDYVRGRETFKHDFIVLPIREDAQGDLSLGQKAIFVGRDTQVVAEGYWDIADVRRITDQGYTI
jgi:hypothetical protein